MSAVIFDIGNVLIEWRPEAALGHLFATEQQMADALERIDFAGWNLEQDRGRSWAEGVAIGAEAYPEDAAVFETYAKGLADAHRAPIAGTATILYALAAQGVPVFALTNASVETVQVVREMHNFMSCFADVVISGEEGLVKPDAAIFETLINRNGLQAQDCIFVDDSPKNVAGAIAAGLKGVLFESPAKLEHDLRALGVLE